MNTIDSIMADVFTACNSTIHGRAGNYFVAGNNTPNPMFIVIKIDKHTSMFDTGGIEFDFNLIQGLVSANDIPAAPKEQGRGTVGDTFIFTDTPSITWHVRNCGSNAVESGNYYDVVLSDYNGPITGM